MRMKKSISVLFEQLSTYDEFSNVGGSRIKSVGLLVVIVITNHDS